MKIDKAEDSKELEKDIEKNKALEKALEETHNTLKEKEVLCESLEKKYNELMAAAKLIAADFDNFRKRISTEQQREKERATKELVTMLLPILDQFSFCLANSAHYEEFVKAISLAYNQLITILGEVGLKQIPALNQTFDPQMHEALMFIASDKENVVVEELQKGYFLHDDVIRTSKVKVAMKEVSK